MPKHLKSLWVIFLVALILRSLVLIVAVQYPQRTISNDTPTYIQPAESLLEGHGYTFPGVLRTPIYPMFLAFFFALFGENLVIIILAQVIVSALTVVLTYQAGILLLPRRAPLIGALLLALSLESIIDPFFILTDALFAFLFLGAAYAFLHYRSDNRILWLISSAMLMGLSILCRPIAIYYPVVVIFLLAMLHWKHWLALFAKSLVYLAVLFAVLAAWFLRSQVVDGAPILSTISNYNLLFYNVASLDASLHGGNANQYRDSYSLLVQKALDEKGLPRTQANLDKVYKTLAMQKILANPVQFAIVQMRDDLQNLLPRWANTLQILAPTGQVGIQGADVLRQSGLSGVFQTYFGGRLWLMFLVLPFIILLGVVYLSDIAGTIFLIGTKGWFTLAILILPAAYLMLIPGAPSNSRFRIPAMPELCLLAGMGMDWIWVRINRKRKSIRAVT
jgi:4-amino-4-deoxy-L-arabinose transferase-like glycosyltransferase